MENFQKRNEDFFKVVCRIRREGAAGRRGASMPFAVRMALREPAPSFYLTREHVWKQLRQRRHRLPPREKPHRRRMWLEIENALQQRLRQAPKEHPWEALDHVLAHHRPSGFFITEEYARKLVYRMMAQKQSPAPDPACTRAAL